MYDLKSKFFVEIELTTKCNAACPQCSRNYQGGRTSPSLPITDMSLSTIRKTFDAKFLSNVRIVRLCGTYGDPLMHRNLLQVVDWIRQNSNAVIHINTNGSLRSLGWWKQLASNLQKTDIVFFGIDGLEDTHHLHRQKTNFSKIVRNAQMFNEAGGSSVWSFLIFEHNQHQVDQARALSQQLGFQNFVVKSTSRFFDSEYKVLDQTPVRDSNDNVVYWIKSTTDANYVNRGYQQSKQFQSDYAQHLSQVPIVCNSKKSNIITVSAEGYVVPCGWLLDRFYSYKAEGRQDKKQLFDMIERAGGLDTINIKNHRIEDIIQGNLFQLISQSWSDSTRLERCAHCCGTHTALTHGAVKQLEQYFVSPQKQSL